MQLTRNYKEKIKGNFNYQKVIKKLAIAVLFLILGASVLIFYRNENVNTYKDLFLSGKYIDAKKYYEDKVESTINKKLSFSEEVASFLDSQRNNTLEKYNKKEINDEAVISFINEIKSYNLLSEEALNKNIYEVQSTRAFNEINILLKESNNYEDILKTISETEKNYPKLEGLATAKQQALSGLKIAVLTEGKTLSDKGKFSEAINKLESKASYFKEDIEYQTALNNYKTKKAEEIKRLEEQKRIAEEQKRKQEEEKKKAAEALAVSTSIKRGDYNTSEEFINATNLSSSKSYLIYVNIADQTTEIFKGSRGNWKLAYRFISSTGKSSSPTPRGVYKVTGRGSWFFSQKYQQGGKYYVQFWGNYLFHSLPMDIDKNVVDPTLGTQASHGCVRLSVDDAKWLYDNIPNGATVFIK